MQTTITTYCYDTSKPEQAEAYRALRDRLLATPGRGCRITVSQVLPEEGPVTLDTTALLASNQWNTTDGRRVYDWAEVRTSYKDVKRGYYLDITPEMLAARNNTLVCGFCGHRYPSEEGLEFCHACLDSPYLSASELHLLRLAPVLEGFTHRPPLTETERFMMTSAMHQAKLAPKIYGRTAAEVQAEFEVELAHITAQRDGELWLIEHGIMADNVLYNPTTKTFLFGWKGRGLDATLAAALERKLATFPAKWGIKRC